jgi:hypothetical protein
MSNQPITDRQREAQERTDQSFKKWKAMSQPYFVIHKSEDGDLSVTQLSEEELKHCLQVEEGCNYWGTNDFLHSMPDEDVRGAGRFDLNSRGTHRKLLIIKGQIIVPEPKQTVTEWQV